MLKSTYQAPRKQASLPPGWTAHTAPTGHPYYYNATTKQSTYTFPSASSVAPAEQWNLQPSQDDSNLMQSGYVDYSGGRSVPVQASLRGHFQGSARNDGFYRDPRRGYRSHEPRRYPQVLDRPKSKQAIPGHEPWLLVRTRFGRQFVHNPAKEESFWRVPEHLKAVVEELKKRATDAGYEKQTSNVGLANSSDPLHEPEIGPANRPQATNQKSLARAGDVEGENQDKVVDAEDESDDEMEEAEVTDFEEDDDDKTSAKRPRLDEQGDDGGEAREFNEDDIAYQLAAMGQEYGLESGEYGEDDGGEWEEGAEGLALTTDESTGLFKDMLGEHHLNPYSTWEKILQDEKVIEDERYTVLDNMKSRREVWAEWSRDKIRKIKDQRAKEEAKNPLLHYLTFLEKNASVKLYWPEFKRRFRAAPEMRDVKVSDKQREKWYRDYIGRLKLPESRLISDFLTLLRSQPLSTLNQSSSPSLLPMNILTDIRFVSIGSKKREELLETYIATLDPLPIGKQVLLLNEEQAGKQQQQQQQQQKQQDLALAHRQSRVATEKRRADRDRLRQRQRLLHEEAAIAQATTGVGKDGLRTQLVSEIVPDLKESRSSPS